MHYNYEEFCILRDRGYPEGAIKAHAENCHGDLSDFEDCYIGIGEGDSEHAAIGEYIRELDGAGNLGPHVQYIDWDAVGRDEALNGSMYAISMDAISIFGLGGPNRSWYIFHG